MNPSYIVVYIIVCLGIVAGCSGKKDLVLENESKYDPSLRSLFQKMDRDGQDEEINVLIKLSTEPDESVLEQILKYDITIDTVVDSIVTVRGKASTIRKFSADPLVSSVSLSQIRKPLQ
jgi:hypothetical protein